MPSKATRGPAKGPRAPTKPNAFGHVPKVNKAVYLGNRGYVDTDIEFADFFAADHTLVAWWMPQYPTAYQGPIFAENGGGTFAIGQWDAMAGDSSNPFFFVQVGTVRRIYQTPEAVAGKWLHVAVVRDGDTFKLYLNGVKKAPVKVLNNKTHKVQTLPDLDAGSASKLPTGKLRLGRRTTSNSSVSHRNWQAYGLIDDIAVFTTALSAQEIKAIKDRDRLLGFEQDLLAGLSFEAPLSTSKPLPTLLRGAWKRSNKAYHVAVSATRASSSDAKIFDNPLIVGRVSQSAQLPFAKGEVWRVNQGYDHMAWSHFGASAFAYDMTLFKPNSGAHNYPNGNDFAPLYAVVEGNLVKYRSGYPSTGAREPYKITMQIGPNEIASYMHLADGTLSPKATNGVTTDGELFEIPLKAQQKLAKGEYIGKAGPKADHLHFGAHNGEWTIPIAFDDYEASDDNGATWHHVFGGHPKEGQLIKRVNGT